MVADGSSLSHAKQWMHAGETLAASQRSRRLHWAQHAVPAASWETRRANDVSSGRRERRVPLAAPGLAGVCSQGSTRAGLQRSPPQQFCQFELFGRDADDSNRHAPRTPHAPAWPRRSARETTTASSGRARSRRSRPTAPSRSSTCTRRRWARCSVRRTATTSNDTD